MLGISCRAPKREGESVRVDAVEIELRAIDEPNPNGCAVACRILGSRQTRERLRDADWIARARRHDLDARGDFETPAQSPGKLGALDIGMARDRRQEVLRLDECVMIELK